MCAVLYFAKYGPALLINPCSCILQHSRKLRPHLSRSQVHLLLHSDPLQPSLPLKWTRNNKVHYRGCHLRNAEMMFKALPIVGPDHASHKEREMQTQIRTELWRSTPQDAPMGWPRGNPLPNTSPMVAATVLGLMKIKVTWVVFLAVLPF